MTAKRSNVTKWRAKAERQRKAIEADLRSRLTREVTLDGSLAQSLLLEVAISSALEIAVLSQRFVRCFATPTEMERLAEARAQLLKTLARLRVPKHQDVPAVETIEDIQREYAERGAQ